MRLKSEVAAALVGVFAVFGGVAHAQSKSASWQLTTRVGLVRNFQIDAESVDLPSHSPYAFLQLDRRIARVSDRRITILAGFRAGYWTDGVDSPAMGCSDCITFAYESFVLGLTGTGRLTTFKTPISLSLGVSRHTYHRDPIEIDSPSEWGGVTTADVELSVSVPLSNRVFLDGAIQGLMPIDNAYINRIRSAYTLGLSYAFGSR